MEKSRLISTFEVQNEIVDEDTRFLNVTIDVMHTGVNLNKSSFEKKVVDENIDSIKNTPVLGFIKCSECEKDFAGHESIITKTDNGIEEKYLGHAYGVIPESCNPRWVTKMCPDGIERLFLQVDALLWTKFDDSTFIVNRDGEKSQSMELEISSIEGEEDENGIFHFSKFRFDGCCILGDDKIPAMSGANVSVVDSQKDFTINAFMQEVQKELKDKYNLFSKIVEKNKIKDVNDSNMSKGKYTQTMMSLFKDVANIVKNYEQFEDEWGWNVYRYRAVDIQDEEVIVADAKDNYNYYGLKYTVDNDKPIIDFTSATRKKICYTNYEDKEDASILTGAFSFGEYIKEIQKTAKENLDAIENEKNDALEKFSKVESELNDIKPKYEVLVEKEKEREKAESDAAKESEFSRYEAFLSDVDKFAELKAKKDELSVKEIASECAIMYAEKTLGSNRSAKKDGKFSAQILDDNDSSENYNYAETKYGNIPVNRK